MVDIHCHILPGVDDGSQSWEMTTEMCRAAVADGITHIVATPHANHRYEYDRERFAEMLAQLHDSANGKLSFSLGCDFHFSYENIQDALEHPRRYTIGDTRYLLIEFSDYGIPPTVREEVLALQSRGMVPIITHPERNQWLLKKPELVLELMEQGCLVQVTASAATGAWGSRSRRMVEWLLEHKAIHVIASDAHDPVRRTPVISEARKAIAKLAGAEVAQALADDNPAAIVEGRNLPWAKQIRGCR
jgi:protein-tyrosine phosphatase